MADRSLEKIKLEYMNKLENDIMKTWKILYT